MLTPNTAQGINAINTQISDELRDNLISMKSSLEGLFEPSSNKDSASFGRNMDCSFLKNYTVGFKEDLDFIQKEMELSSYISFLSMFVLLLISLASFLIHSCFPRVHHEKASKVKALTINKVEPKTKSKGETKKKPKIEKTEKIKKSNTNEILSSGRDEEEASLTPSKQTKKEEYKKAPLVFKEKIKKRRKNSGEKSTKAKTEKRPKFVEVPKENSRQISSFEKPSEKPKKKYKKSKGKDKEAGKAWKKIDDVKDDFIEELKKQGLI
jgi:hypothetical protein